MFQKLLCLIGFHDWNYFTERSQGPLTIKGDFGRVCKVCDCMKCIREEMGLK